MNGMHQDSLGPAVLSQWVEFLDFYVAQRIPSIPPATRALAAVVLPLVFGAGGTLAPDRFTDQPDYASALRAYEAEPEGPRAVRRRRRRHAHRLRSRRTATSFPLPGTTPTTFYLGADGALAPSSPSTARASDAYHYDPRGIPGHRRRR